MESSQLAEKRPWELPWWKPSDGNRKTFTYIVSIHVLALVGIFLFPIPGWGLFLLVLAVISCCGLGTSLCYHRALAHRSVKLHPVVEQSLIFSGYFVAGWKGFFWLGAIRLVYILHMQMFVNSLLHMTPGLPEGVDSSRNVWWLGPFQATAWGENWHRNHHSKSASACFSREWWQVDVPWYVIKILSFVGLATNVRT